MSVLLEMSEGSLHTVHLKHWFMISISLPPQIKTRLMREYEKNAYTFNTYKIAKLMNTTMYIYKESYIPTYCSTAFWLVNSSFSESLNIDATQLQRQHRLHVV